ncbi:MAG: YceI family protein [Saprospiraceae bacterium]
MPIRISTVFFLTLLFFFGSWRQNNSGPYYRTSTGKVRFVSDAPLERIEASSERLRGALDAGAGNFAWTVAIRSLKGFNSDLQLEHFNENYLESAQFPDATFEGRIIEEIDYSKDGAYSVRAKGKFSAHGRSRERIIPGRLVIKGNRITISAQFYVPLQDHDISIPKIVHQKIAEEIQVEVLAELLKQPS